MSNTEPTLANRLNYRFENVSIQQSRYWTWQKSELLSTHQSRIKTAILNSSVIEFEGINSVSMLDNVTLPYLNDV